jgi:CBS domain containing-hemolysin-like protein
MQGNIAIIGIALCVAQAALLSGINLAAFSIGRLRLKVEAADGNRNAIRLLAVRRDSSLILRRSSGAALLPIPFSLSYRVRS